MSLGALLRASTLLALVWIVLLGPRAWPSLAAARDPGSLLRAALLVSSHGCERHDVDDLLWRCEAKGILQGAADVLGRQAALAHEERGEEPGTRYEPGTSVDVAIVAAPFGGGLRLFEGDRGDRQARAKLETCHLSSPGSIGAAGSDRTLPVIANVGIMTTWQSPRP